MTPAERKIASSVASKARWAESENKPQLDSYRVIIESLGRLTISEALRIAEQQTAEAQKAKDAGEPNGEERLEEWSDALHALQS